MPQPDPETITEAELAEALRDLQITPEDENTFYPAVASAIFERAKRSREPEYEPGQIYEDIVGARYLCWYGRPLLQWVRIFPDGAVQECHHDAPVRPLRKLVPEADLPKLDREVMAEEILAGFRSNRAPVEIAARICTLMEGSDGH
jgi:hypothetical protein